jgi:hypothetical protein
MSAQNLELLNSFRAAEDKAPLTAWKKARHQPLLDAYMAAAEAEQKPVDVRVNKPVAQRAVALPANPDSMRAVNEELGADIKATRAAWKASGAGMSKKDATVELMLEGATIKDITDALGVTPTAARSLVGDVRRIKDANVTRDGDVYYVAFPSDETEEEDGE